MKVFCAAVSGPGHAFPMLAVARALAARGHAVTFASGREHRDDAERHGLSFVEMPAIRGSPLDALRPYDDALDMARALAAGLTALRPDVGVVDLITFGPALALEATGVPWATLSIHPLHLPSRELPPFGWGRPPARGVLRWRDELMRRTNARDLRRARDDVNRARTALGLPTSERLVPQLSGELILVATLPSLEVPRRDWPAHAHVVGPCLWPGSPDAPALPPGDAPLVLVALSTAHGHPALIDDAVSAVAAIGARAVVTTGKSPPPRTVPPGVVVVPFASHDALLPHCDAVVCNGGHGIVARALSAGVPLVVVPGHGDQRENGYRVERAGAGVRVLRPTRRHLVRAVGRVLRDPAYARAAARLRDEASSLDGPARSAELVETLARAPDAPVDVGPRDT